MQFRIFSSNQNRKTHGEVRREFQMLMADTTARVLKEASILQRCGQ